MIASAPLTSQRALGRFNLFGLLVDQQSDIMGSDRPTSSTLVVENPYQIKTESKRFTAISYDPERNAQSTTSLPCDHYQLHIQAVIHHHDFVGAFEVNGVAMSFVQPVTYHPVKLMDDMMRHLRQEISKATEVLPMIRQIRHDDLDTVIIHGEDADAILYGHLHQDEINQVITLTVPLWMGGDLKDEVELANCTLNFLEDMDWTSSVENVSPVLRSYLLDIDAATLYDEGTLS